MIISLIVAMDEQGGIGKNNQLPWHLSSDLARFKRITMGHYILMGRKTYETIGKSLPGRTMIILTHRNDFQLSDCIVVHSIDDAVRTAQDAGENELFIIGGGVVFKEAITRANKIYLTLVHARKDGDVFFPRVNLTEWALVEKEINIKDERDDHDSEFMVYHRKDDFES